MRHVYLAGPITGELYPNDWREQCSLALPPEKWTAINPCALEVASLTVAQLVRFDYNLILRCNAVIANVSTPSWGTAMEIAFAKQHDIPVVGWVDNFANRYVQSPWLEHHTRYLAKSWQGAVDFLGELR